MGRKGSPEIQLLEEVRAASLQFIRKISGFHKPSKANEAPFLAAVDEIASASFRLLRSLETNAPTKNRKDEAATAKAGAVERFGMGSLGGGLRMKNLFEAARVEDAKERLAHLRPDSERLWGSKLSIQDPALN
jgi:hypothetical protein